jgi:putative OPT family oligopeptide transporter
VLNLLAEVYGFGAPTKEHPQALRAPQAMLMASVARGVFRGDLPWNFVLMGGGIAALCIGLDRLQKARQSPHRLPVLALAVGIYLPAELTAAMVFGAVVAQFAPSDRNHRLLLSAGLITGEALMGIVLAVVAASALSLPRGPSSTLLGVLVFGLVLALLWRRRASS